MANKDIRFLTVEDLWFWAMRPRGGQPMPPAVCSLGEVLRAIDHLYRARKVSLADAMVMRRYGAMGYAPDKSRPREAADYRVWTAAIGHLRSYALARNWVVLDDFQTFVHLAMAEINESL